jgi:hypothetical protein
MSTDLFDQYATLDPAETPEALPDCTSTAAVLLAEIDERTHPLQTKHRPNTSTQPKRRWTGVLVAAAAFAVVLIVGVSLVLLNRGGDPLDVVTPATTTTATTVPELTPTTAPVATPPVVPDETTPVVVTVPSESAAPEPIDEISGISVADGSLWASTGEGIVRWDLEERNAELFTPDDGVPMIEGFAPAIAAAPDGSVWAYAYYPQNLVGFDGSRWSEPAGYNQIDILNPRCSPDDDCPNPITAMAVGPDGVLFLALGDGALVEFDGVVWHVFPDTPVTYAADMAVAADGTLWVASLDEVLAYDGDTWTRFTAADGLPSGGISSVAVAPNGDLWVGTIDVSEGEASGGVARFDGDTWTVFDETDGLYDNSVTALAVGPGGTVWTVHGSADTPGAARELAAGGVARFNGETWSATPIADVGAGFGSGGAAVDDAGMLWIVSDRGVVGFDGAEATVLRAPEGVRPEIEVPHVVVEGGEDILATTLAKPTPPVATCPTGTDPNGSGPVDQARPPDAGLMALDRHSGRVIGRVVAIANGGAETWAFDVCTNTWTRMTRSDSSLSYNSSVLVYDADSDLVVAIGTSVAAYDVDTDTWERHGETPLDTGPDSDSEARAIYDPVSGLIVVRDIWSSEMWAYDVDTDTWTEIEQGPISPPGVGEPIDSGGHNFYAQLHAYDASTDRIVLYLSDNYSGPGVWDGAGTETTWTFDLRAGEWTIEDTVTPELGVGGWFSPTGKAAYDEAAQRTVITGDGVVGGYDAARHEWEILWANPSEPDVDGIGTGLHNRFDDTVVYDPTNDRIIVIGGSARMPDDWVEMNDVWAFDTGTGRWTELLASSDP